MSQPEPEKKFLKRVDKSKRIFQRLATGLQIAKNQEAYMRFMTLTSGATVPRPIKESFDILRQRIERATWFKDGFDGFKFNRYFCLRTKEGPNGVLHIIFWGKYIPQKWLSWNWEQIHWAFKADIRACWTKRRKVNGLVSYLLGNYLMNQPIERMSYGWKWAWLGFCKSWKNVKKQMGLIRCQPPYPGKSKWCALINIRNSPATREQQLMSFKDKYKNVSMNYWRVLTWFPLSTTRKTSFCNPDHTEYNKKYFEATFE